MSHRHDERRTPGAAWDVLGLSLLACLAGWALLAAQARGGDATDLVVSLVLLGAAYIAGRRTSRWAWAVAILVLGTFVGWELSSEGALDGGPLAGPLGYANANAALAVQVVGVCLVAASRCRSVGARVAFALAAIPVLACTWINGSAAGLVLGAALLATGLAVLIKPPSNPGPAVAAAGVIVAVAVVGQLLIAAGVLDDQASRALSERRVALWSDAVDLAQSQPIFGHGPHSFATSSPTAASDTDTQAAHSALLETAAETGWVGAGLLLLVAGWAFVALARGTDPAPCVVGAAAWSAFALHSLVDYVADFPAVIAIAGLTLGLAIGAYRQNNSMSPRVSAQPASAVG